MWRKTHSQTALLFSEGYFGELPSQSAHKIENSPPSPPPKPVTIASISHEPIIPPRVSSFFRRLLRWPKNPRNPGPGKSGGKGSSDRTLPGKSPLVRFDEERIAGFGRGRVPLPFRAFRTRLLMEGASDSNGFPAVFFANFPSDCGKIAFSKIEPIDRAGPR